MTGDTATDATVAANLAILYGGDAAPKAKPKTPGPLETGGDGAAELCTEAITTAFNTKYLPLASYRNVKGVMHPPRPSATSPATPAFVGSPIRPAPESAVLAVDGVAGLIHPASDQDVMDVDGVLRLVLPCSEDVLLAIDANVSYNYDESWNAAAVGDMLKDSGLDKAAAVFQKNGITGVDLADLELDDVLSMGLKASHYEAVMQACVSSTA